MEGIMIDYPDSGVYLLKLRLDNNREIKIGALGQKNFPAGYFFYAGTAQKNLKSRIRRHYSKDKKMHWHIDYLLKEAELIDDYIFELPRKGECFLAELMQSNGGQVLISGFGASDCGCKSHLFYFSFAQGEIFINNILNELDIKKEFRKYQSRND
jgi:Uri superfamily endonuclease